MHINLKTQGLSDVASQNKQACISSSSHPYFFFLLPLPPRVFKDGGKEEKKKKANFNAIKLLVSVLCVGWRGSQESSCFFLSPQASAPPDSVLAWSIPKGYSTSCPEGEGKHKGLVPSLGHNLC